LWECENSDGSRFFRGRSRDVRGATRQSRNLGVRLLRGKRENTLGQRSATAHRSTAGRYARRKKECRSHGVISHARTPSHVGHVPKRRCGKRFPHVQAYASLRNLLMKSIYSHSTRQIKFPEDMQSHRQSLGSVVVDSCLAFRSSQPAAVEQHRASEG